MIVKERITGAKPTSESTYGGNSMTQEERKKIHLAQMEAHKELFSADIRKLATTMSGSLDRRQINELLRLQGTHPANTERWNLKASLYNSMAGRFHVKAPDIDQALACIVDRRRRFGA